MRNDMTCAASMVVRLQLGGEVESLPAKKWAERLGLAWDTVRQRRYRGSSWTEAFRTERRRSTFNDRR